MAECDSTKLIHNFVATVMLKFCVYQYSYFLYIEKATITVRSKQNNGQVGDTISVTAVVTGNPLPTVITVQKWNPQTGDYVDYPSSKHSVTSLSVISILNVSLGDDGQYRVCVDNSHNSIECDTFNIIITGEDTVCGNDLKSSHNVLVANCSTLWERCYCILYLIPVIISCVILNHLICVYLIC